MSRQDLVIDYVVVGLVVSRFPWVPTIRLIGNHTYMTDCFMQHDFILLWERGGR